MIAAEAKLNLAQVAGKWREWVSKVDPASGHTYYVNKTTKQTQWDSPWSDSATVESDWIEKSDPNSDRTYHVNKHTKKSQWHPPSDGGDLGNITPDSFEHVFSSSIADSGPRP